MILKKFCIRFWSLYGLKHFEYFLLQKNQQKRNEKILKELEKKIEIEKKKTERLDENLKTTEEELIVTKKVSKLVEIGYLKIYGYSQITYYYLTHL